MSHERGHGGPRPLVRWSIRLTALVVSAGILFFFTRRLQWEELKDAALQADLVPALAGAVVPLLVFWLADAAFTVKSFAWFYQPVRFFDYLTIKAAAYFLNIVNLAFSTGGVFLYFLRKTGISARCQAGILLWRVAMAAFGTGAAFALIAAGIALFDPGLFSGIDLKVLGPILAVVMMFFAEWALYWLRGRGLVMKRLGFDTGTEFWTAFRRARPWQWGAGFAYTVPPIFVNLAGYYFVARAFHIQVPFFYFLVWIPLISAFAALPIAFGGFGTTTAAWAVIFAGYGTRADIVAATVFLPAARLLTRALLGVLFLPLATRELESLGGERKKT